MTPADDFPDPNPYAAPTADLVFEEPDVDRRFLGYAGFWLRSVAFLIDYIVTYVLGTIIRVVVASAFFLAGPVGPGSNTGLVMIYAFSLGVSLAIGIAYFAVMESSTTQATLGKMALGLKVTDHYGRRVTFGRATGRYMAKYLSTMSLGVGYVMAAFTARKQALHDLVAGTLVVRTR